MGGFKSHGMVLCAKNEAGDVVEFVDPPADAKNGDRVSLEDGTCDGFEPSSAARVKKNKVWEKIAPELKTNDARETCFQGTKLVVSGGKFLLAPTLSNVHVS